ncbi:alpha/beta hydrolase [Paenibacillus spongiae]|uniref:Alpha/beta hydrolase n=1 Tax=Paenibacillus spongiae TaxID=2909671 RepID=A0ABY5S5X6_9BACL|nr:alpha/beta hydrolase [Paenibacillus spongiae]UVI28985.1 alpha/beta hydrolase [Paenibacillus spongiae]
MLGSAITISMLALAGIGYKLSGFVIHIRTYKDEEIYKFETNGGTIVQADIERMAKEEVSIESPFGYRLRGWFFPAEQDQGKLVVLVHGVTSSLVGSLKYMDIFRRRGFHVLAYDHRRHGLSGGPSTTYGYYEKHDLKACIDWALERYGPDCKIGVLGESMGAATALQHAAIDRRAAFYIVDCPYSDLTAQLKYRLKKDFHMPPVPLMQLAGLFVWMRTGMKFKQVSPIRDVSGVDTPILFIHGDADDYIPMEMTLQLHEAKPGFKRLYLMPGADHAQSLRTNREEYDRVVGEFLAELGLAEPVESTGVAATGEAEGKNRNRLEVPAYLCADELTASSEAQLQN